MPHRVTVTVHCQANEYVVSDLKAGHIEGTQLILPLIIHHGMIKWMHGMSMRCMQGHEMIMLMLWDGMRCVIRYGNGGQGYRRRREARRVYAMQRAKTKLHALNGWKRLWVLVAGIAFWVIPLSILYLFGYGVGWVYLGFKWVYLGFKSDAEKRR